MLRHEKAWRELDGSNGATMESCGTHTIHRHWNAARWQQDAQPAAATLLLSCLRQRWQAPGSPATSELGLQGDAHWQALTGIAQCEGLAPLLYYVAHSRGLLPAEIDAQLRHTYQHNLARNLRLSHELGRVLDCLAQAGVRTILLKGAALISAVYPSPALRPMADLDLLVRREQVPTALVALQALGYEPSELPFRPDSLSVDRQEVGLTKPEDKGTVVEVHWDPFSPFCHLYSFALDWFWHTAIPVHVGAAEASVFGPEAQVLHLCAHILKHRGLEKARLIWLHDVAEVVYRYRDVMNWDELVARAEAYRLVLPVEAGLSWAAQSEGAPVPARALIRLRAWQPSCRERSLYALRTRPHHRWVLSCANLISIPGWAQRLRYLSRILFPSSEYMAWRYGVSRCLLAPLSYPRHWVEVLRGRFC